MNPLDVTTDIGSEQAYVRFKLELDSAISPCVIHNVQIISGSLVVRHDVNMVARQESHFYAPCLPYKERFIARYFTEQTTRSTLIIAPRALYDKWDAAFVFLQQMEHNSSLASPLPQSVDRCVRINKLAMVERIKDTPEKLVLISDATLEKWQSLTMCAEYIQEYWQMLLVPSDRVFGDFFECLGHYTRQSSFDATESLGRQLVGSLVNLMCSNRQPHTQPEPSGPKVKLFNVIMRWLNRPAPWKFTTRPQHKMHELILKSIIKSPPTLNGLLCSSSLQLLIAIFEGRVTNRYFDRIVYEPPVRNQRWRDFLYTDYIFSVSSTIYVPRRLDKFGTRLAAEYNYMRGEASMTTRDSIKTNLVDFVYIFKPNIPKLPMRKSFIRRDDFETCHINRTTFKCFRTHYLAPMPLIGEPSTAAIARKVLTPLSYLYDQISQFDHVVAYETITREPLMRSSKNMCIICRDSFSDETGIPLIDRLLTQCECKTSICRTCTIQLYKTAGTNGAKCPVCRASLYIESITTNPHTLEYQFKKLFEAHLNNRRNIVIASKSRVPIICEMLQNLSIDFKKYAAQPPVAIDIFMSVVADESLAFDINLTEFENIVLVDLDNTSLALNDLPFNFIRHGCLTAEQRPAVHLFVPRFVLASDISSSLVLNK